MSKKESQEKSGKEKETQQKPKEKKAFVEKKVFVENIVRLVETNLDGKKTVKVGLRDVRGVSFMFGNTISNLCGFGDKKIAELSNEEKKKLEDMILNPGKYNIPSWMLNRRKSETGEDKHITVSTLQLTTNMDINELKKLRCYKGVRHSQDLPVRGQRTRGSFRKGKTVGVRKKAVPSGGKN